MATKKLSEVNTSSLTSTTKILAVVNGEVVQIEANNFVDTDTYETDMEEVITRLDNI